MNSVVLMGRLTAEPKINMTNSNIKVAKYTLAVDRRKKNGEQSADFISCVAWDKSAGFAEMYLHKGTKICVRGRIQTGSYEKDGRKVYTTDVVVEEHEFCESKSAEKPANNGFMNIPDGMEEELPFN